ncbi:MAG: biotin transporter BioY [Anaerotignum sp.]|nr:biotin transporter BioY [Anaerotignum sp.]
MKTNDLTRTALMAAVLCILAPISIPVPVSSVSLTLATFALYLMAYILKPKQALAAVGLYLLLWLSVCPFFPDIWQASAVLPPPAADTSWAISFWQASADGSYRNILLFPCRFSGCFSAH